MGVGVALPARGAKDAAAVVAGVAGALRVVLPGAGHGGQGVGVARLAGGARLAAGGVVAGVAGALRGVHSGAGGAGGSEDRVGPARLARGARDAVAVVAGVADAGGGVRWRTGDARVGGGGVGAALLARKAVACPEETDPAAVVSGAALAIGVGRALKNISCAVILGVQRVVVSDGSAAVTSDGYLIRGARRVCNRLL